MTIHSKVPKSAIQLAHENIDKSKSKAEDNIRKLLMFSSVKLDKDTTKKVNVTPH